MPEFHHGPAEPPDWMATETSEMGAPEAVPVIVRSPFGLATWLLSAGDVTAVTGAAPFAPPTAKS